MGCRFPGRSRLGGRDAAQLSLALGRGRTRWLDDKVKATKTLSLPTLYFQGEWDGVNPPPTSEAIAEKFTGPIARIVLPGVGHLPTREAPTPGEPLRRRGVTLAARRPGVRPVLGLTTVAAIPLP
jgi:pimeloyl-ACP methyl ester carboxylesterase